MALHIKFQYKLKLNEENVAFHLLVFYFTRAITVAYVRKRSLRLLTVAHLR